MLARLATVEAAAKAKATLVVSKLDRLSRAGIRFMVDLDRQGVSYVPLTIRPSINSGAYPPLLTGQKQVPPPPVGIVRVARQSAARSTETEGPQAKLCGPIEQVRILPVVSNRRIDFLVPVSIFKHNLAILGRAA